MFLWIIYSMPPHQPSSTRSASSISVISLTSLTKSRFLDLAFSTWHLLPFCQARHPSTEEDSKPFQTQKQSKCDVAACYSLSSIRSLNDGNAECGNAPPPPPTTRRRTRSATITEGTSLLSTNHFIAWSPLIGLASAVLCASSTEGVPLGSLRSSSNSQQSLLEKPIIIRDVRSSGGESRKSRIWCKCKNKCKNKLGTKVNFNDSF